VEDYPMRVININPEGHLS